MNHFFQSILTFFIVFIFTTTLNAQTVKQAEIGNFIEEELDVSIGITDHGKGNLTFDYNDIDYYVFLDSKYIRIVGYGENILLFTKSDSDLEIKVAQSFKDIINEVTKKFHITKAYWEPYDDPAFQLLSAFSTSIPNNPQSWKSEFKTALTSTEKCAKLFNEKYIKSLSYICWKISQNETDPDIIREAIFWAKNGIEMQPDADRTYLYATLLFKSGQTLLALEKINETIELCKKEGQNYDLSTTLKEKLVSILSKDEIGLFNIRIENQEWQNYNLRTNKFRNGDEIFQAKTDKEWTDAAEKGIPAWCYYNNDKTYGFKLGKLYNWYAVNDTRGLAPKGWHVPSVEEWNVLIDYFGKNKIGKYLKSKSNWASKSSGEYDSDGNGDNYQSFNALPGGFRHYRGYFNNTDFISLGNNATWWATNEDNTEEAHVFELSADTQACDTSSSLKGRGYSVRCLKD